MSNFRSLNAPGMPCPNCRIPIVVDPLTLLGGQAISCSSCGLVLKIDREQSAETLTTLQNYLSTLDQVNEDLTQKNSFSNTPKSEGSPSIRSGRQRPKRRPRNR